MLMNENCRDLFLVMSVGIAFICYASRIRRRSRIPMSEFVGYLDYNVLFGGSPKGLSPRVLLGLLVPRYLICGVLLLFALRLYLVHCVVEK